MFIRRLAQLLRRRKAAARLGVHFKRCSTFQLPKQIVIGRMCHPLILPNENGTKVAFIELLLDDCYGCRNISKEVKTVLDIGANVGLFGIIAREVFPNAVIHAYEPNPHLEKYLKVQATSGNFKYFMDAVGLDNGRVSLEFNEDSVQTKSQVDRDGTINQIAFRDAIGKLGGSVDLVKMDCEGAEWELLQDAKSWGQVHHLSMEYHLTSEYTQKEALRKVRELGFHVENHIPMDGFGLILASR